jgi:hypothetical protein
MSADNPGFRNGNYLRVGKNHAKVTPKAIPPVEDIFIGVYSCIRLVLSNTLHLKISCGDEVLSAGRYFSHDQQRVEH